MSSAASSSSTANSTAASAADSKIQTQSAQDKTVEPKPAASDSGNPTLAEQRDTDELSLVEALRQEQQEIVHASSSTDAAAKAKANTICVFLDGSPASEKVKICWSRLLLHGNFEQVLDAALKWKKDDDLLLVVYEVELPHMQLYTGEGLLRTELSHVLIVAGMFGVAPTTFYHDHAKIIKEVLHWFCSETHCSLCLQQKRVGREFVLASIKKCQERKVQHVEGHVLVVRTP